MMNRNRYCNDIVIEFENEEEIDVDFNDRLDISQNHNRLYNLDYEVSGHTGFMPSRLSLLNDVDPSINNNKVNLLASVENQPSKITIKELQDRIIRTSNTVSDDLQVGQYLFKEIE